MARSKIAIIGTGLIGTSIGLNLMSRKDRSYEVVGIDRDRTHARAAKKLEAIDREVGSLEEAVTDAGLVILAVPVQASHDLMESMGPYLRPGAVVTDTCSTKSEIMRWAKDLDREAEIVLQCHIGQRSLMAANYLQHLGFKRVYNLAGGIDDWSRLVDPKVPRY